MRLKNGCAWIAAAALMTFLAACSRADTGDSAEAPAVEEAPAATAEIETPSDDVAREKPAVVEDEPDADDEPEIQLAAKDPDPAEDDLAEERALADRLMTAMGFDVMIESLPEVFADATARSVTSCTPATPEQDVRELSRIMREELIRAAPRYYERLRDSYARRLSLEELQAMVDFYATPEGEAVADAAAELIYDQYVAQIEIDRASLRAYERMGWCDNTL